MKDIDKKINDNTIEINLQTKSNAKNGDLLNYQN